MCLKRIYLSHDMYILYELNHDHKVNQMVKNASVYFEKVHFYTKNHLLQFGRIYVWSNYQKDRVNDSQKHVKFVLKRKRYF